MTDQQTPADSPSNTPSTEGPIVNTPDGTPLESSAIDPATGAPGVDTTAQERMEHGNPTGDAIAPAGPAAFVQTSPMYTGSPHEASPDRHNAMRDVVGDTVAEGLVAQAYAALQELDSSESRADDEGRRSASKRLYAAGMGDPEIAAARRRLAAANNDEQQRDDDEAPRDRRALGSTPQTTAPAKSAPAAKKATAAKTTTAKK
jgi:hypothetical protein